MQLTVYYDYGCPFCFLGSRRIEQLAEELDLGIEWKGIEIHPEIPPSGIKRKRTPRSEHIIKYVSEFAREEEMEIRLPGFVTNTRLALELSELGKERGVFREIHYGLYEAYFQQGVNIGDKKELLGIGEKAGIRGEELRRLFTERTMKERVDENEREARENVILGVPTYLIEGISLYGNQSAETMRMVVERAMKGSQKS